MYLVLQKSRVLLPMALAASILPLIVHFQASRAFRLYIFSIVPLAGHPRESMGTSARTGPPRPATAVYRHSSIFSFSKAPQQLCPSRRIVDVFVRRSPFHRRDSPFVSHPRRSEEGTLSPFLFIQPDDLCDLDNVPLPINPFRFRAIVASSVCLWLYCPRLKGAI